MNFLTYLMLGMLLCGILGCSEFGDSKTDRLVAAVKADKDPEIRKCVTAGANVNGKNRKGQTPLSIAFHGGVRTSYATLLELGANPNEVIREGKSLMAIMASAEDSSWLTLALEAGGDPSIQDTQSSRSPGSTPLLHAIQAKNKASVEVLLKHKADIDHVSHYRSAAFPMAAMSHQFDIALLLLENGADISVRGRGGEDVVVFLQRLDSIPHPYPREQESFKKVKQFLIEHGYWKDER